VGDLPAAASQPSGRAFALAVKAAFVVLTVLGFATLWGAIAADMGASLLVVFNGLRLMRESGL
jgi:Cd2+/Zn2+-exporting ATPase